jgi:hypothetical protein
MSKYVFLTTDPVVMISPHSQDCIHKSQDGCLWYSMLRETRKV